MYNDNILAIVFAIDNAISQIVLCHRTNGKKLQHICHLLLALFYIMCKQRTWNPGSKAVLIKKINIFLIENCKNLNIRDALASSPKMFWELAVKLNAVDHAFQVLLTRNQR